MTPRCTLSKLLLFDIDGTLLLSGGAGLRALNQTFEELFGVRKAFDGIPVAGGTDPLLLQEAAVRSNLILDNVQRKKFHDRYCDLLEGEILKPSPRKSLMPGVKQLLKLVDCKREWGVGLLTGNYARAAQIKLEHFKLWDFFGFGAYGEDAGDRDGLLSVAVERARKVGVCVPLPTDVVVIGDTPQDIRCAMSSAACSIAVATGSFDKSTLAKCGATVVLSDFSAPELFFEAVGV